MYKPGPHCTEISFTNPSYSPSSNIKPHPTSVSTSPSFTPYSSNDIMDSEADANLLLALDLSDTEPDEAAAPKGQTRADRSALSDVAFQALKETYKPKVENGEVCSPSLWFSIIKLSH